MTEWYRNRQWNAQIAAHFEARLRAARKKAEYLVIQGYTLLACDPATAAALLRRAVALNDPDYTARAALYLGTALACTNKVDAAIDALETAIAAEARHPAHRTAAHLDQALVIAAARREHLYDRALAQIAADMALPPDERHPNAVIADALIRSERGEDRSAQARSAMALLGDADDSEDAMSGPLAPDRLRSRLTAIANRNSLSV